MSVSHSRFLTTLTLYRLWDGAKLAILDITLPEKSLWDQESGIKVPAQLPQGTPGTWSTLCGFVVRAES